MYGRKYNHHHDDHGRFASGDGGSDGGGSSGGGKERPKVGDRVRLSGNGGEGRVTAEHDNGEFTVALDHPHGPYSHVRVGASDLEKRPETIGTRVRRLIGAGKSNPPGAHRLYR